MQKGNRKDQTVGHDPIAWIEANLQLKGSNAAEFWYDRMESQSGRSLAVIYQPFDGARRGHFVDRGQILDFALSAGGGRVLDFGPGDGWPALLMAPMVEEVVGVEGSRRRVEVCSDNARRLGIGNARFVYVLPGRPLLFEDNSFDAVTAASSIEQTPDPKAALSELHRVLVPGGRVRISYESLGPYRNGRERAVAMGDARERPSRLLIFDRHIEEEHVRHYAMTLDLSRSLMTDILAPGGGEPDYERLTQEALEELCAHLVEAATWTTRHPCCRTWLGWLRDVGFSAARPTWDGGWFAREVFEHVPPDERPTEIQAVDDLLRPLVQIVIGMEAPAAPRPDGWDPMITAIK